MITFRSGNGVLFIAGLKWRYEELKGKWMTYFTDYLCVAFFVAAAVFFGIAAYLMAIPLFFIYLGVACIFAGNVCDTWHKF